MEQEKNLQVVLCFSVIITVILFLLDISSYYYLVPVGLLIIALLSSRLSHWIVKCFKDILNLVLQVFAKTIISVLFFVLLFPAIIIQQLYQKFNS